MISFFEVGFSYLTVNSARDNGLVSSTHRLPTSPPPFPLFLGEIGKRTDWKGTFSLSSFNVLKVEEEKKLSRRIDAGLGLRIHTAVSLSI